MFKCDLGDGADMRIFEQRHAQEFLDYVEANRDFLGKWLGWAYRINTVDDAAGFIGRGLKRFADDGLPWIGIWQDNQMVGGILFFPLERQIQSTEIGYWLGQGATGRGLMTRSVRAVLGYVFDELKLNRVGLIADVDNLKSIAVAERLGFTHEGTKRDGWKHGDNYVDVAMYSMLARDWQELE